MKKSDPLSFLDNPEADPLSFLDEIDTSDPLSFLESKEPDNRTLKQKYQPEEKTPEQLKKMSIEERMQFNEEANTHRELRQSSGFVKGGLSGLTLGASEYIPGLKPDEEDLMTGLGSTVGSYYPIGKLYNFLGKPLVTFASKSPIAKQGLMSLARITGFGLTGAAYEGGKELVQGEIPSPEELAKEGGTWAAIDAVMQGIGLGKGFGQAVSSIAKAEGITAKEVLGQLWNSTKNFTKQKFGRTIKKPTDIRPEDIEILVEETAKREKEVAPEDIEIAEVEKIVDNQPVETISEPNIKIVDENTNPSTGYQRKPEPKTYQDKINHLVGKIKDSQEFQEKMKHAIYKNKFRLEEVKDQIKTTENPQELQKLKEKAFNLEQNLANKKAIYKSEKKFEKELKKDIQDLKKNKETSKVQVPLGKKQKPLKSIPPTSQPTKAAKQPIIGQKQAVARSKIIKMFRKAFNDPIIISKKKMGKIPGALGLHNMWAKVTRLIAHNDIETAAHEIGHNLHTTLYGGSAKTAKEQERNVINALKPYSNELNPLGDYEPFGLEGFAEFTRMYVTNPDSAQQLAPNFYQKFENDLRAQFPEMLNALLEARDYYDKYLEGTPQSRIRAQTAYQEPKGKLENLVEWVKDKTNLDKLKTEFLDDVFPAKRLVAEAFGIPLSEVENLKDEKNLYRSLRVLKGAIGKADVYIGHETFRARTLEKINGSLESILKQLPDDESYKEFNDYLIARRVIEKSGQGIKTGISKLDALIVERDLRGKYENLAQELDQYNNSLLEYARDSGLISKGQFDLIKKNNAMYTPFQRDMEKDKAGAAATSGKLQAGNPIKRMKGSTRDIIPPIESIIKNTYSIIINAEKNMSGQVLAKIAGMKDMGKYVFGLPTPTKLVAKISKEDVIEQMEKNTLYPIGPDIIAVMPDFFLRFGAGTYPAGENIVTVFYDGKPKYYEVSPELYEMWTKGIAPYTANLITKILRVPARALRAGAILNPRFIQKNFIRDTWGSWLFTKYGKSIKDPVALFIDILYSPLANLAISAKQGPLYVEWMKSGGGMSTMQSLDRDSIVKKLEEVRNGYKPHQIIKWLRKIAEISEEANRLSEFGKALEVEGKTRLGMEIAAFASRDLSIDFAKMGLQTKAWNQVIPFFNATIQGSDKLIRQLGSKEDRDDFLLRAAGFILIPSLIFAWLNKDDERVQEFQEQEKDFNFITFIGNTALKIPVPFETGVIVHGLAQRMFNFFIKKNPEAFEGYFGSIKDAMLPNFIPAIANPIIETMTNKSFFTGARIIPAAKEGLVAKYQYKNYTSVTARLLGRAMNYLLGEETRSKAASPAVIDHFINSWTAGLGRLIVSLTDQGLEAAGLGDKIPKPEQAITEKLGLDAFTARYPRGNTSSIEKFYDNYQDATARNKSFKYATKMELESEKSIDEGYKRFNKLYDYPALQAAYRAVQRNQKAINNIFNDPMLDSDVKKEMIDELYRQQIAFCRAANEDLKKYRRTQKGKKN